MNERKADVKHNRVNNSSSTDSKLDDLLFYQPGRTIRNGSTVISASLLSVILVLWLIEYPLVVRCEATIVLDSKLDTTISKDSGRMSFVREGNSLVSKGDVICHRYEEGLDIQDLLRLEKELQAISSQTDGPLPQEPSVFEDKLSLGSFQDEYTNIINKYESLGRAGETRKVLVDRLLRQIWQWEEKNIYYAMDDGELHYMDLFFDQQHIDVNRALFRIIKVPERIHAVARIPMSYFEQVKIGQQVTIASDSDHAQRLVLTGEISKIRNTSFSAGTFTVGIDLVQGVNNRVISHCIRSGNCKATLHLGKTKLIYFLLGVRL